MVTTNMQYKHIDKKQTKDKHKKKTASLRRTDSSAVVEISFHTEDESSNFLDPETRKYARAPGLRRSGKGFLL